MQCIAGDISMNVTIVTSVNQACWLELRGMRVKGSLLSDVSTKLVLHDNVDMHGIRSSPSKSSIVDSSWNTKSREDSWRGQIVLHKEEFKKPSVKSIKNATHPFLVELTSLARIRTAEPLCDFESLETSSRDITVKQAPPASHLTQ